MKERGDRCSVPMTARYPSDHSFYVIFFVSKEFDLLAVMFVLLTAFSFPFECVAMYDKIKKPANYNNA